MASEKIYVVVGNDKFLLSFYFSKISPWPAVCTVRDPSEAFRFDLKSAKSVVRFLNSFCRTQYSYAEYLPAKNGGL